MADQKDQEDDWSLPSIIDAGSVQIRLKKDGEEIAMIFRCRNTEGAERLINELAAALDWGCVHFHTTSFYDQSDEIREAMEERRATKRLN